MQTGEGFQAMLENLSDFSISEYRNPIHMPRNENRNVKITDKEPNEKIQSINTRVKQDYYRD